MTEIGFYDLLVTFAEREGGAGTSWMTLYVFKGDLLLCFKSDESQGDLSNSEGVATERDKDDVFTGLK